MKSRCFPSCSSAESSWTTPSWWWRTSIATTQGGKPLKGAVVDGTAEVFLPVLAATSTTVAAFLPMLIMSGSTGEFFSLVPKAVSFAIAASLIECLFILPLHFLDWPGAKRLEQEVRTHSRRAADPRFLVALKNGVDRLLQLTLRHRWKSLLVVFGAFLLAVVMLGVSVSGVMPLLRIKFFPDEYSLFYVLRCRAGGHGRVRVFGKSQGNLGISQ